MVVTVAAAAVEVTAVVAAAAAVEVTAVVVELSVPVKALVILKSEIAAPVSPH
jgi:hypothetical protein